MNYTFFREAERPGISSKVKDGIKTVFNAAIAGFIRRQDRALGSHVQVLDGIRGLAIFFVLGSHLFIAALQYAPGNRLIYFLRALTWGWGAMGVQLFFVLSGFLITTLLLQEWDKHGQINLKKFYIRRSLRILPVLYLYLGFVVLYSFIRGIYLSKGVILGVALYVHNFQFAGGFIWLDHMWSLGVEEQFYLLWPVLLIWGLSHPKRLINIIILFIVAAPFIRFFSAYYPRTGIFVLAPFTAQCDKLLIGILASLLLRERRFLDWIDSNIGHRKIGFLFVAVLILCSTKLMVYPLLALFLNTLLSLSFAWLILYVVTYPGSRFGNFCSSGIMKWLGIYSYSIYIWQQVIIFPMNDHRPAWLSVFPVNLILTLLAAFLSYNLFEKQFLKLKERFK